MQGKKPSKPLCRFRFWGGARFTLHQHRWALPNIVRCVKHWLGFSLPKGLWAGPGLPSASKKDRKCCCSRVTRDKDEIADEMRLLALNEGNLLLGAGRGLCSLRGARCERVAGCSTPKCWPHTPGLLHPSLGRMGQPTFLKSLLFFPLVGLRGAPTAISGVGTGGLEA